MSTASTTSDVAAAVDVHDYEGFLRRIQERFLVNMEGGSLFKTDAEGLFEAYLDALPDERQYHTCDTCRWFMERFGGLVVIDDAGATRPAVWYEDDAPDFYKPAVAALARLVRRARVTGVFLSPLPVWGKPVTGSWTHFAVTPPPSALRDDAHLAMALKREEYGNVQRALAEFPRALVDQVVSLLDSEILYRSERVAGPARWLAQLHGTIASAHSRPRENLVWRAVAAAPAAFCHPRDSVVGSLLEDLAAGMDFAAVSRRFSEKMHPLQYQRPTVAPSAGNIAQAEKLVEQLGIARSLLRRFARIDEVVALWKPEVAAPAVDPGGVFGHLTPKGVSRDPLATPPITMTWEKFARTVLPGARSIEFFAVPRADNYAALVTAVDPDAPPILQWDHPERRNPVSLYLWHGGSRPDQWRLASNEWHRVTAVTLSPSIWGGAEFAHQGQAVLFVLSGAVDTRSAGNAIFPSTLKNELREVRSTLEAYSKSATLEGREQASACGILLSKGQPWDGRFRVRTASGRQDYRLDRWD